jgi:hypothetical protein
MKRMFRIQRMFHRRTAAAILAGALLLLSSLPAAAAGGTGRPAAEGPVWRELLAEVSAWLGERAEAGMSLLWGAGGSSIDPNGYPNGGTATTFGDGGSSIDPNGRP